MSYEQLQDQIKKRDRAIANAKRQRRKMKLSKHTKKEARIRPEFWEQVARDCSREITRLRKIQLDNSEL